jgi:hypothetical protein
MTISLANMSASAAALIQGVTPDSNPGNDAVIVATHNLMAASQIRKKVDAALAAIAQPSPSAQPTPSDVSKLKNFTAALADATKSVASKEAALKSAITTQR